MWCITWQCTRAMDVCTTMMDSLVRMQIRVPPYSTERAKTQEVRKRFNRVLVGTCIPQHTRHTRSSTSRWYRCPPTTGPTPSACAEPKVLTAHVSLGKNSMLIIFFLFSERAHNARHDIAKWWRARSIRSIPVMNEKRAAWMDMVCSKGAMWCGGKFKFRPTLVWVLGSCRAVSAHE